ncbi:hypothetical protein AURDEDRAFT_185892 [Auricularia subglabra TFB-10046 SS5]|nr:hypothetical protein AURDEDRAFT_185892 [Auricularia subglabra TFB-10046 SS5]
MSAQQQRLEATLTPRFLQEVFEARVPFAKERELDFSVVAEVYLLGGFDLDTFRDICYPALETLSTIPMAEMPDLMQYLPPPEDPAFPLQCFGLLFLLDQGRLLLEGMDERWLLGFFDPLSVGVARRVVALPDHLRPNTLKRWRDMGYTFGHWVITNFWFIAIFGHSEQVPDHEIMLRLTEELRDAVEKETGTTDPFLFRREQTLNDPSSFVRAGDYGPPKGDNVRMEDYTYWFLMLYEAHVAIVRTFGRIPFYNGALGREDTEEEKQWLGAINRLGCVTPMTEKRIREDVLAGRWTRLGG